MVESIKETLQLAQNELNKHNIESFYTDSLILLCFILNCEKTDLIINKDQLLTESQIEEYFKLIEKRKEHMPVKYIVGICEFMSLDFYVNENVLIPRPDTEIAVEEAMKLFDQNSEIKILDLCCGSGCIGISLAMHYKNATCLMVDISEKALQVANKNREKHGLTARVACCKADVLNSNIADDFNLIISNPPYISEEEYEKLEADVLLYEPEIALVSRNDENKYYKAIINNYTKNILPGGYLIFETSYSQAKIIKEYLENTRKYSMIQIIKDLSGIERVIVAKKLVL